MGFYAYASGGALLRGRRSSLEDFSIFVYSHHRFHHRKACQDWYETAFAVHGAAFSSSHLSPAAWPAYHLASGTRAREKEEQIESRRSSMRVQSKMVRTFMSPLPSGYSSSLVIHSWFLAYIVYMGEAPAVKNAALLTDLQHNVLSSVSRTIKPSNCPFFSDRIAKQSRIYSYTKSFNAFAANLLPNEAERLRENENVVSVFPSRMRKLHTTRSWDFLRMPLSVKRNHQIESNITVGVLDTGIYIDAPSFNDKGLGPPPSKYKGRCQIAGNVTGCNNKVIGATFYANDPISARSNPNPSPIDDDGHGSHTASTIAGTSIAGASFYGLAKGTARGGVPSARIAMYKVCWNGSCSDIDLLAGLDDAIDDGIDVLSISIGGGASSFFEDSISIGAFHAMKRGIFITCSAGNDGPSLSTVVNTSPWIMTVGASSIDRQFRTPVQVGNGLQTDGHFINTFSPKRKTYPLTTAGLAASSTISPNLSPWECIYGTLDANKVKGKIVLCNESSDEAYIKSIGGAGDLVSLRKDKRLQALVISYPWSYYISIYTLFGVHYNRFPQAVIYKSKTTPNAAAPFWLPFHLEVRPCSLGTLLKPDVVAPGVNILAAYTKLSSMTGTPGDNRFDVYTLMSGTSMSCPHVAGAAAYVKTFHPKWSPSAIKSALMTTASELKIKAAVAELGYGAGQIDPVSALHPGLIYDLSKFDYIRFLCGEGYSGTTLRLFTEDNTDCASVPDIGGHDSLNYPSMYYQFQNPNTSINVVFHRTVTNVGPKNSIYKATVKAPRNLKVSVIPNVLAFSQLNEKKSFNVTIQGPPLLLQTNKITHLSASLEWSDAKHRVRSPIFVTLAQQM
ncbi:subtilisin-like protease SBT4.15 [Quercus suber]|uniref:subtilisin-like protease SBT4.15 n=1 Tax=Quercus suber TaxID=58331 RepID=UPI0032DFEE0B